VDASIRWNVNENLSFGLEMLNLTNQTSDRYAYLDNPVVTQSMRPSASPKSF
jgi:outer membrane receptor protein involved in Fe transport